MPCIPYNWIKPARNYMYEGSHHLQKSFVFDASCKPFFKLISGKHKFLNILDLAILPPPFSWKMSKPKKKEKIFKLKMDLGQRPSPPLLKTIQT